MKQRDQEIISAFGGKAGSAEKVALSRYKCEKLWENSQNEMRRLISRIAPDYFQRHNLIRFASIIDHLILALSWHKKLVELSIDSEYAYLLDDAILPSVAYMKQLQKITAVINSYIRIVESNDGKYTRKT